MKVANCLYFTLLLEEFKARKEELLGCLMGRTIDCAAGMGGGLTFAAPWSLPRYVSFVIDYIVSGAVNGVAMLMPLCWSCECDRPTGCVTTEEEFEAEPPAVPLAKLTSLILRIGCCYDCKFD